MPAAMAKLPPRGVPRLITSYAGCWPSAVAVVNRVAVAQSKNDFDFKVDILFARRVRAVSISKVGKEYLDNLATISDVGGNYGGYPVWRYLVGHVLFAGCGLAPPLVECCVSHSSQNTA